ncbi:MAG: hypothetical protein K2K26_11530 [Muribaculaceae bacterium]|nr:hypothetical protein [Muribaculaceae bacterium]
MSGIIWVMNGIGWIVGNIIYLTGSPARRRALGKNQTSPSGPHCSERCCGDCRTCRYRPTGKE